MADDLYQRLLTELGKPWEIWAPGNATVPLGRMRAALLAAVERHKATTRDTVLPACEGCSTYAEHGWVSWVAFPCGELQLIAEQLGLG